MTTAAPATKFDKHAAGIARLMAEPEIKVSLRDGELMGRPGIDSTSGSPDLSVPLDALAGYRSKGTFFFDDPKALEAYFSNTSPTRATATKLRLAPMHVFMYNPPPWLNPPSLSINEVSLPPYLNRPGYASELFTTISAQSLLLPHVLCGNPIFPKDQEFIDLINDWRAASRAAPKGHEVEEVTFDLAGSTRICSSYISRLLQHVSTVLAVKAKGPFHSRFDIGESYLYKENVVQSLASNQLYVEQKMQQELVRFLGTLASMGSVASVPGI
ncbi:hypothetical protein PITC_087090 [Penicillium italicum]|uniref:Uncharacterized protein n=1 Tax=Penicillium italicum TaxID=40296 RepID=A0A0A2KB43_PENIT|nr:hypothetical protein PITC_087090 [Penicillium italicum]